MTADRDFLAIDVDGLTLDSWQSASFASDLFSPCDSFNLKLGIGTSSSREMKQNIKTVRDAIKAGAIVRFYVSYRGKMALQGTGIAEAREISNGYDEGTSLVVQGRDFAAPLVGSAAELDLYKRAREKSPSGTVRLLDLAKLAVEPWADTLGIGVTADAVGARNVRAGWGADKNPERTRQDLARSLGIPASKVSTKIMDGLNNGTIDPVKLFTGTGKGKKLNADTISAAQIYQLKVKDAATQAGETVWSLLDRHAKRLGGFMRMGPDGKLVISKIDYDQAPRYTLHRRLARNNGNNIISGGGRMDTTEVYSQVRVVSRGKNTVDGKRYKIDVTVDEGFEPNALPYQKLLLVHDDSIRDAAAAENRARYEMAKSNQGAYVLTYQLRGFGTDGNVYAADTIASVDDEVEGVKGEFYVISRQFDRSDGAGPMTTLRLVPKDSIVLDEAAA